MANRHKLYSELLNIIRIKHTTNMKNMWFTTIVCIGNKHDFYKDIS